MPKAVITTTGGATVTVEGTQEEVAALLARFQTTEPGENRLSYRLRARQESKSKPRLMGLLSELIAGGFFSKPKGLGAVKLTLEEQGHFYPVTTLSPVMLRLVRRKELRRIKNDKQRWAYVG